MINGALDPTYWTAEEINQLHAAYKESDYGQKPVCYLGDWILFREAPIVTYVNADLATVQLNYIHVEKPTEYGTT